MELPDNLSKIKKYIPKIKKIHTLFIVLPLIIICSAFLFVFLYELYDDYKSRPEQVWKSYPLPEISSCRTVQLLSDKYPDVIGHFIGTDIANENYITSRESISLKDHAKVDNVSAFLSQLRRVNIEYFIDKESCKEEVKQYVPDGFYVFEILNLAKIIGRLKTSHFYEIMYRYDPKLFSQIEKERFTIKHQSLNSDKKSYRNLYIRYPVTVDDIEIKVNWLFHSEAGLTDQEFLEKFSTQPGFYRSSNTAKKGSGMITIRSDWYKDLIKNENDSIVYHHSVRKNYKDNNLITIEWLADYYKTSVEKIRYWNNMKIEDKIQPYDRIKILLPKKQNYNSQ